MPISRRQKRLQQFTTLLSPVVRLLAFFSRTKRSSLQTWGFVLSEHQGLDGNVRTLFHYAYHHPDIKVYLIDGRGDADKSLALYPDTPVTGLYSFRRGHFALRVNTDVCIISHGIQELRGLYEKIPVKVINVWHGIPLKGMANLDNKFKRENIRKLFHKGMQEHVFCVSSSTERALIAGCFLMDAQRIQVTGIPRNDWLCCDESLLPEDLRSEQKRLEKLIGGKRLVLYAPTFRDYDRSVCGFDQPGMEKMKQLLVSQNAVLGIRAHPRDGGLFQPFIDNETIVDLDHSQYPEISTVLRATDILITDYSSLWVDFLLRDKAILAYTFDLDKYQGSRGLLFDYENQFPGPLLENNEQLLNALGALLDNPDTSPGDKQQWIKRFFHQPRDLSSCETIHQRAIELVD